MLTDPFGTNDISRRVIGCAIRVHDQLGPGVFEKVYDECLGYELAEEGLQFERGRVVPIVYKGVQLESRYYLDMVIENCLAVELKSAETLLGIHRKQLLTYVKLAGLPVGLLINFNVETLTKGGINRIVNPNFRKSGNYRRHFEVPIVGTGKSEVAP